MTSNPNAKLRGHSKMVIKAMMDGDVVPFFGSGINLADRPPHTTPFNPGINLPNASELAQYIADNFDTPSVKRKCWHCSEPEEKHDLMRVSWFAAKDYPDRFRKYLHNIFSADYEPNEVHKFFARLPQRLAAAKHPNRYQLIVTTNYDDVLERAFNEEGEPFDLLSYIENDPDESGAEGKFMYFPHGGEPKVLWNPNDPETPISGPVLDRTMILKIHGAVNRADGERSSFVVTEDDYIDYLRRMTTPRERNHIPAQLLSKMIGGTSFLFLGYSLSDWNMRLLFHSIWPDVEKRNTSWAVMRDAEDWVQKYWEKHKVKVMKEWLNDYITALDEELAAELPDVRGGVTA